MITNPPDDAPRMVPLRAIIVHPLRYWRARIATADARLTLERTRQLAGSHLGTPETIAWLERIVTAETLDHMRGQRK